MFNKSHIELIIEDNGKVTGDKSNVIGYGNTPVSAPIQILHPSNEKAIHKIIYVQSGIRSEAILGDRDIVSLTLHGPGIVRCMYVQQHRYTGATEFCSQAFQLLVSAAPTSEAEKTEAKTMSRYFE